MELSLHEKMKRHVMLQLALHSLFWSHPIGHTFG